MTKPEHVETHFLARLAEVYGDASPALRDAIARRCPQGLTPEQLQRAAERIIDTRKARTLPAPIEIIEHLAKAATPQAKTQAVTAQTYADLAIAHCHGRAIRITPHDAAAWSDWRRYYRAIGYAGSAAHMAEAREWFVPAPFPHDFDPSFPAFGEQEPTPQPETAEHRARAVNAAIGRFAAAHATRPDPKSPTFAPTELTERQAAQRRLDFAIDDGLDGLAIPPRGGGRADQQPSAASAASPLEGLARAARSPAQPFFAKPAAALPLPAKTHQ